MSPVCTSQEKGSGGGDTHTGPGAGLPRQSFHRHSRLRQRDPTRQHRGGGPATLTTLGHALRDGSTRAPTPRAPLCSPTAAFRHTGQRRTRPGQDPGRPAAHPPLHADTPPHPQSRVSRPAEAPHPRMKPDCRRREPSPARLPSTPPPERERRKGRGDRSLLGPGSRPQGSRGKAVLQSQPGPYVFQGD